VSEIVWTPGWRQFVVPSLAHAVAIAGIVSSASWLVWWLLAPVLVSFGVDIVAAARVLGRRRYLRLAGTRFALKAEDVWRSIEVDEPWLGPKLIVLRVHDGMRRQRWWLWRHEIGSSADAELRRVLRARSTRNGLQNI
jgi:hypothetical protein